MEEVLKLKGDRYTKSWEGGWLLMASMALHWQASKQDIRS